MDYTTVPSTASASVNTVAYDNPGIRFRIPRSLITITATTPAADPKASPTTLFTTVIDPIATGTKPIPFARPNDKYSYTLTLAPDTAGVVTRDDFFAKIATGDLHIFPAPSCSLAQITIYGAGPPGLQLTATAVPTDLELPQDASTKSTTLSPLYAARPIKDAGSTTVLNVQYLGDTKIIKTIGSAVTDNTQTLIKTLASVATAAAAFAPLNTATPAKIATVSVTVADNRYVQPVTIPSSGTLTFHDGCGVDVVDKSDTTPQSITDLNLLVTAMTQAKSVYSAVNK